MGNKQGHELSPEEKQRLKQEKQLLKEDKERKKRLRKVEQKRIKEEKKRGSTGSTPAAKKKDKKEGEKEDDAQSVGGSSVWSEKSVGSAPESWYHSASEPGSKRSSIYLPASAGPGYYQHDCWYSGYEDGGSEKSKPNSRVGSRSASRAGSRPPSRAPSVKDTLNLRSSSLERYPLGVPKGEVIETSGIKTPGTPIHKAGSLDLTNVAETVNFLENREQITADLEIAAAIASRYEDTLRSSKEQLERTSVDKASLIDRASLTDKISLTSSVYQSADDESIRGEKRKVINEDRASLSSVYYSADESGGENKRKSLDYASDRTSATGSIYYSADEGGSVAGSVYYSANSGSEVEDHVSDADILGKDRPSPPSKPVAVDREGSALSRLAYIKVENDALLLHWEPPVTDGGTPISGYILERCEGDGDMWVRVNLVPIKDCEYAVANLIGGRQYRFRVSAENAVGMSDPSELSEMVSISTDQEATEPHFLKELRDVTAVEGHRVEFVVDVIGTPPPDISWYKDGYEVFDTKRYEFIADGDRYTLVLKEAKITDAGDIRVRATNRIGVAASQAVLHIQAPPHINLPTQYDQGLIFDTDELIRLRVPYIGKPQPIATWAHNGKQIETTDRHTMDVSEKYVTLKIAGASRLDKGMYALNLTNAQGIDNVSFFVTVTDRPDAPSMPVVTDISGQAVTLRWDPPQDDGGCRISNYIVEYFRMGWDVWLKGASSRITWTQLPDLIVGSEYRFRVKAENAYGVSDAGEECDPILIDESKSPTGYGNNATCHRKGSVQISSPNTCTLQEHIKQGVGMNDIVTVVGVGNTSTNDNEMIVVTGDQDLVSRLSINEGVNIGNPALGTIREDKYNANVQTQQHDSHHETRNQTLAVMTSILQSIGRGYEIASQGDNTPKKSSGKRSNDGNESTQEGKHKQKLLKTDDLSSPDDSSCDTSNADLDSSPESTSEYSSDNSTATIKYIGTENSKSKFGMIPLMPKSPGNPNPSCHLGFVSNGCSKVNFLGSVIGIETDSESSRCSSATSPSNKDPLSPISFIEEGSRGSISSTNLAPNNSANISDNQHSTLTNTAVVSKQSIEESFSYRQSFQANTKETKQTMPNTLGSYRFGPPPLNKPSKASYDLLAITPLTYSTGYVDQSDMNQYFEQMKDKIDIPDDFYHCKANPLISVADSDPNSNDDSSTQDDSDTDTIVYSPSKGTDDAQNAICETHDTVQGETGDGISSIPFDTSASKSWSTPASGTFPSRSGLSVSQRAMKETCSTFQGSKDTGEGVTSIPLDTLDSNNSTSLTSSPSPSGEPWMSRVAIAHKFRIICGGLASMKHLGNINALTRSDSDSDETESQDIPIPREGSICRMRTFSNDETIDEDIGSIQSEEVVVTDAEIFKDDDDTCNLVLPYQQMNQRSTMSPNSLTASSLEYPPLNNQSFFSENAVYLSPNSCVEATNDVTSPPSLNDVTVFYQPTHTSSAIPVRKSTESQKSGILQTDTNVSPLELENSSSRDSQKSTSSFSRESSYANEEHSSDKIASWEPKINKALTSRINLLEDLVYKCLENEDAALNVVEHVDEEGAGTSHTSISRSGSNSRVDVRKDELRGLISDLEGLVSGINVQARTLSADNVAKFFEKTASIVCDPTSSSSSSRHSKEEEEVIKDILMVSQSPHSMPMSDTERPHSEGSHSSHESISDIFHPVDQIHIKPSILKRIDHLEDVMNRCLENDDIAMNTLPSGVLSPMSMHREEIKEHHHSSKVELKDLIGDLGSLVSGLGEKFNPDKL